MSALSEMSFDTLQTVQRMIGEQHQGGGDVRRDVTTGLGLVNFDLQRPAKMLVPVITPILQMTPRVPGNGGTATNWKQVTALNTSNLEGGIPEGGRNARVTTSAAPKSAPYATIGQEDSVTFEADTAAQSFEDVRATTAMRLLLAEKIAEERSDLGGNFSMVLARPSAPTVTDHADVGGNFLHAVSYNVGVVALTLAGLRATPLASGVPDLVSVTGADGDVFTYGGGSSRASTLGNVTTGSGTGAVDTHTLAVSVPAVPGAVGYAWYVGSNSGAHYFISKITTLNSTILTNLPSSGQRIEDLAGTDQSTNQYLYDGLLTYAFKYGSVTSLGTGTVGTGSFLTADGAGGIVEINDAFKAQWDTNKVSPTHMFMNSQEIQNIYTKVIGSGGAPLFRFNMDADQVNEVTAGRVIGSFLNKFTMDSGQLVKIILHPDMPAGTIMLAADSIPGMIFPGSNLGTLWESHCRRDYYQIEWPLRSRKYETGVYTEKVLVHYFPATMSVINNIGNG